MRTGSNHARILGTLFFVVALGQPREVSAQQTWSLEPVLTLGSYDGEVTFGSITGVAARPTGEILVLDRMEGAVLVFDAEGAKLGEIGKKGEGPGELSDLAIGLYLTDDGTLVIPDIGNSRVSFFNADASYSHSFRLDLMATGMALAWATWGGDQILMQVQPAPSIPGMPARGPAQAGIMSLAHDGTELGMVTSLDLPPMMDMEGGKMRTRMVPEVPVWTTTPEGHLVVGRSGAYRLEVRDIEGTLVSEITREVGRKEMTAEIRDWFTEQFEKQMAEMDVPPSVKEMMGPPIFSDSLPVIGKVLSGPNGTIMVARGVGLLDARSPEGRSMVDDDGPAVYDILSLQGEYLGVLEMPPRFSPRAVRGSLLYGVAKDEFDVETVEVYELRAPGN